MSLGGFHTCRSRSTGGRYFPIRSLDPRRTSARSSDAFPLQPWRTADLAIFPVAFPIAAVLDTAAGWHRVAMTSELEGPARMIAALGDRPLVVKRWERPGSAVGPARHAVAGATTRDLSPGRCVVFTIGRESRSASRSRIPAARCAGGRRSPRSAFARIRITSTAIRRPSRMTWTFEPGWCVQFTGTSSTR